MTDHDPVNSPRHYLSHPSGVECIQITEHMNFNLGNCVKYVWRADLKLDAIEDLKKARFYLDREIAKREREAAKREREAAAQSPSQVRKKVSSPAPLPASLPAPAITAGTPKLVAAIVELLSEAGDRGLSMPKLRARVHAKQRTSVGSVVDAMVEAGQLSRSGYRYVLTN